MKRSEALAPLPESHIRDEERGLFPLIEATLAGDELEALGAAVLRAST